MNRIAQYRRAKGLTQEEAARAAGITLNAWYLIEHGKRTPTIATARKIAAVLGVTIDELFA